MSNKNTISIEHMSSKGLGVGRVRVERRDRKRMRQWVYGKCFHGVVSLVQLGIDWSIVLIT